MRTPSCGARVLAVLVLVAVSAAAEGDHETPAGTADRPGHGESARRHAGDPPSRPEPPPLPPGMTLDEVLDRATSPPPADFPDPVHDDPLRAFFLGDQLEYRRLRDEGVDAFGWETHSWLGFDYDKLWWKSEGEVAFEDPNEGEAENDLLYSRLITPFWYLQAGVQYANEWAGSDYSDRWSGALALQGLAPGMFEMDNSLYVSGKGDVTAEIEAEYDLRVTQRFVLQPRIEMDFSAQDVSERDLGAGMTGLDLDLRARYEIRRQIAPYVGVRYRLLVGETGNIADAHGEDDQAVYFLAGLRLAF